MVRIVGVRPAWPPKVEKSGIAYTQDTVFDGLAGAVWAFSALGPDFSLFEDLL
jgi:hypothetical protein